LVYITKIKSSLANQKEQFFYQTLLKSLGPLQQHIPKLNALHRLNGSSLLTLEYVHGRPAQLDDLDKLLEIQEKFYKISSTIKQLQSILIIPGYNGIPNYLSFKSFTKLSKEDRSVIHKLLFKLKIVSTLNETNDFVFQHMDFGANNIKISDTNEIYVYDWDSYLLALPGHDLLTFLREFTIDFSLIKENVFEFLKKQNISNYDVVTALLTIHYLNQISSLPNGVAIENHLIAAMDFLKNSPLLQ
jgi:thiamine kinase-like enzyme